MISPKQFQIDFISNVFSESNTEDFSANLLDTQRLKSEQQLDIYRSSIHGGLINALSDIYPVCEALTGDTFFYHMSMHYVLKHTSTSPDLADYGENFANFISTFKAADSIPYLTDIAKLEYAYHRAFHTIDENTFNLETLGQYSAEQLTEAVFLLPSSAHLIHSAFPIDVIWNMHQDDTHQVSHADMLEITQTDRYFYVYRFNYEIHIDELNAAQWQFLQRIKQQKTFADVCSKLPEGIDVNTILVESLQNSWINRIKVNSVT